MRELDNCWNGEKEARSKKQDVRCKMNGECDCNGYLANMKHET